MPRQLRIKGRALSHHVVHRGIDRKAIFFDDDDCRQFLAVLKRAAKKHNVAVVAYCLMSNHYHLFLEDLDGSISAMMQVVNGFYTTLFNRRHSCEGARLRGRFYSKPVADDDYALTLLAYIHLNPVRAGLVTHPSLFCWSSAACYLQGKNDTYVTSRKAFLLLQASGIEANSMDTWALELEKSQTHLGVEDVPRTRSLAATSGATIDTKPSQHFLECFAFATSQAEELGFGLDDLQCKGTKTSHAVTRARYICIVACIERLRATYANIAELFGLKVNSVANVVARARVFTSRKNCR